MKVSYGRWQVVGGRRWWGGCGARARRCTTTGGMRGRRSRLHPLPAPPLFLDARLSGSCTLGLLMAVSVFIVVVDFKLEQVMLVRSVWVERLQPGTFARASISKSCSSGFSLFGRTHTPRLRASDSSEP